MAAGTEVGVGRRPGADGSFVSLLGGAGPAGDGTIDADVARDLNLDQVIEAVAGASQRPDLVADVLSRPVHDLEVLRYRQEVFADLDDDALRAATKRFSDRMGQVRSHVDQLGKMHSRHQRQGWFLDAAAIYCEAVRTLAAELEGRELASRGLRAFRDHLNSYVASRPFAELADETAARKHELAEVRYCVRIRGPRVDVTRYDGEGDYSAEVEAAFERFAQRAVKDYRAQYRTEPGMDHVGAQILAYVARLFPEEFSALEAFCTRHTDFVDAAVSRFDEELQFYVAYLDYGAPVRDAGLRFCYPEVGESKEVFATGTFDLALARMLATRGQPVVCNDLRLEGPERIFVVSGPNQGGKTTFARTFGQLHHLASVGCPVPGSSARLHAFDRLFTHFEREEDLADLSGRLETDITRVAAMLRAATPSSVVILNEIFTSTTLADARFLGGKVMAKMMQLDLIGVYVTFVDELASLGDQVVSMVSTVGAGNPVERTYKVVRGPADGLAYALAIAERHGVTYGRLRERIAR
jgi:DNA mismatch repair protein MutS